MPNTPDGVYGHRPWTSSKPYIASDLAAMPPQSYIGPFSSNNERMLSQAMAINSMSKEEIQNYVRPALPQVQLFPNRFGYEESEYGIRDIVELTGRPQQRVDYSQQPTTTESTSRNALGNT
jgi:hypothetical protein